MPHYLHYDVFTNRPFEGNQLAVFPDARGLPAERMQVITREMNFSESTFVLPAEANGTAVRMRIFTPGSELPMAGHPTIGTTFALADLGVIRPGADHFVFGLGLGPTRVELEWQGSQLHFAWMDQRPPEFRQPASSPDEILRAIGLPDAARPGGGPPIEEVSCGVPFLLVPLASSGEVDRAEADAGALRRLRRVPGRWTCEHGVMVRRPSHLAPIAPTAPTARASTRLASECTEACRATGSDVPARIPRARGPRGTRPRRAAPAPDRLRTEP